MSTIPDPVQAVVELFATALADVRFADMDAGALARLATDVTAAAEVVAEAELALEAARCNLKERQGALLLHAQKALSYARVYAESDDTLSQRIDCISLPRLPRRTRSDDALVLSPEPQPAPARRKRPPLPAPEAAFDSSAAPAE
jgi:hypothetical protein